MSERTDGYWWVQIRGDAEWSIVEVEDGDVYACGERRALSHLEIDAWGVYLGYTGFSGDEQRISDQETIRALAADVQEYKRERDALDAHVMAWSRATGCRSPTEARNVIDLLRSADELLRKGQHDEFDEHGETDWYRSAVETCDQIAAVLKISDRHK